jgi:hypothetical protein
VIKEWTTGDAHDVTDRSFVVRRVIKINDSLPMALALGDEKKGGQLGVAAGAVAAGRPGFGACRSAEAS